MNEPIAKLLTSGELSQVAAAVLDLPPAALAQIPPHMVRVAMDWICEAGQATQAMALHTRCQSAGIATPLRPRCAMLLRKAGEIAASDAVLDSWEDADNSKPRDWLVQAQALSRMLRYEDAQKRLLAAAKTFPRSAQIALELAKVNLRLDDRQAALVQFERCLALEPNQPSLVYLLARALRSEDVDAMGLRLSLPANAVSPTVLTAILSSNYEQKEREAVLSDLRDGDQILELGTGIGAMAMWINQAMPAIPMTTVEANPNLLTIIRRNFALNNCGATLIEGVAGLADGEVAFNLADDFWGSSTFDTPETQRCIMRPSVDVNRLIDTLSPTILIMDIEGGEADLIPHLRLDNLRRLIIEMHPNVITPSAYSNVFKTLLNAGFVIDRTLGRAEVFVFDRPS